MGKGRSQVSRVGVDCRRAGFDDGHLLDDDIAARSRRGHQLNPLVPKWWMSWALRVAPVSMTVETGKVLETLTSLARGIGSLLPFWAHSDTPARTRASTAPRSRPPVPLPSEVRVAVLSVPVSVWPTTLRLLPVVVADL